MTNPVAAASAKVQSRPAESGGIAGSAGLLLARLLGVSDPDQIVAIGILLGGLPAAITWLVATFRRGPADSGR